MFGRVARIALWPFTPGASYAEGGFKVALYSMALALFFLFASEWQFPGGAAQFTDYATALLTGARSPNLATRDIGYPLLFLAGGYGITHSFIGLLAWHVVLAWSIPVAVYGVFGREYRHAGFYTASVVAFSLSPYLYLKFIHHDLLYIALSVLSLYLLVEYLRGGRVPFFYGFLGALVATCLTRPAGNLLFIPLLALAWFFRPRRWRHYLAAVVVIIVVLAAYAAHRERLLGQTAEGEMPSYSGRQIFYNLYVNSSEYGIPIRPELGPATARLHEKVRGHLKQHPLDSPFMEIWYRDHGFPDAAREFLFTRFAGQDEAFVSRLFRHPSHDSFEYLCVVEKSDRAFRDVAFEIVRAYPRYPLQYGLRNLTIFLWNPGVAHGRFGLGYDEFIREFLYFLPSGRSVAEVEVKALIPPPGRHELQQSGSARLRPLLLRIEGRWARAYRDANQIAVSLAGVALIAAVFLGSRFRMIVTVTTLFLLYNAAITAVFAEPNYRYHFFVFPMVLVLAGAGVIALLRGFFYLHEVFPSLGTPSVIMLRPWSVEARAVEYLRGLGWRKAAGLALCSAGLFAAWAVMTWQAAAHP